MQHLANKLYPLGEMTLDLSHYDLLAFSGANFSPRRNWRALFAKCRSLLRTVNIQQIHVMIPTCYVLHRKYHALTVTDDVPLLEIACHWQGLRSNQV